VVMVDLFGKAGLRFAVAHVNFGLRGPESDEDELFVRQLASQHKAPFHTIRVNTRQVAATAGISTQMAARQLRYDWFEKLADEFGYAAIATAHHQDDVLETVLINLTRGTGLAGLRGMPVRQGRIIRPLWFTDRAAIEQYAKEQNLRWREDSSNASDYYPRNRLRHQVVPVLKELNSNLTHTLQTTLERLQAAEALVRQEVDDSWQKMAQERPDGIYIPVDKLTSLREWPFRLSEWLRPYGFLYEQIAPIVEAIKKGAGQQFFSSTHRVIRDRAFLAIQERNREEWLPVVLNELPANEVPIGKGGSLTFQLLEKTPQFIIPNNPRIACLDADRVQWPLIIRPWEEGDRFHPLGMQGSQTVGNFFTNRKVPVTERESAWVMLSGESKSMAWLIGYRPDHRFRLTGQTQRILRVEWNGHLPEIERGVAD